MASKKNRTIIIASIIGIAAGIIVMVGWILSVPALQQIIPGFVAMVFNTALCFVLFGAALLLTQYPNSKYQNPAFFILSLICTIIGLVTLLQFLFHFNTGLDQLFVKDGQIVSSSHLFPGRMAFNASINVFLLGLGLLLLSARNRLLNLLAQYFFHIVTILSAIALIGYLYGVSLFDSLLYVSSMATHTAILFFILSIAASLLNPSVGIANLFTGKQIGNQLTRRLFVLMIIMVILFGSLKLQTHQYRFTLAIGIPLLVICFLLVSLVILWNTAIWLNRIDSQRSTAEAEVKLINADLEKRVQERSAEYQRSEAKYRSLIEQASDAIYVLDANANFTDVNASMCKMIGYTREELLQMQVSAIVDPEELKTDPLPKSMQNPERSEVRERKFISKTRHVFPVEINVKRFSDNMILVIARDISGRKKMETELREAELKFRTIAEKSMVGVYIVQNGKFVYVNPRFANVFGYEPEELTNTVPVETIIYESYRHITTENVKKRLSGEVESVHYEAMGLKKDGSANWVEFYGSRANIGNEPTIIGSMIDITERKKAEEELRLSEQKYKLLFDSNPLPLWMIDKENLSIIAVNEAAATIYGYTKDELLKMDVKALRVPEDRERQLEGYKEVLNSSTDERIVRHTRKDGRIMVVHIIANDIIFDGRPVRLSLTNDITEKLKAEESLQKSEANLQTILKTTDTAYALFDLDLKVLAFNQKAIEFVEDQYNHVPEKGDRLADFFPSARVPPFLDFIKEVLSGNNISYEVDYPKADGSVYWYDVKLSPITSDNNEVLGILMALYDITERKSAEQDLKSAYERIQSHINSIKQMAWKQSHLVRSPLANLKALADMLKIHPEDKEALKHFHAELNRLDDIIHEMAKEASGHED
jgi:two-component system, sporulation sensor kinase E